METSNPLVSVIIPVYNCEKFIAEALDSALAQTYSPLEIIVINDGSTDSSMEIVRNYSDIKIISQTNHGVSYARNKGIASCRGEYLAFLDADDVWLKSKIEKQMKIFLRHQEVSVVTTASEHVTKNGKTIEIGDKIKVPYDMLFLPYNTLLSEGNPFCLSSAMVKRSVLCQGQEFADIKLSADYDLWIRIAADGGLFYVVSKKLTIYRELEVSLLHGSLEKEFGALLNIMYLHKKRYSTRDLQKRKSRIHLSWADTAFFTNDKGAWKALCKSFFYNPLNLSIYSLALRVLVKKIYSVITTDSYSGF